MKCAKLGMQIATVLLTLTNVANADFYCSEVFAQQVPFATLIELGVQPRSSVNTNVSSELLGIAAHNAAFMADKAIPLGGTKLIPGYLRNRFSPEELAKIQFYEIRGIGTLLTYSNRAFSLMYGNVVGFRILSWGVIDFSNPQIYSSEFEF